MVKTTSDIEIRPYEDRDLAECQRIAGSSMDYAHAVDTNADAMEVALCNGQIAGFAYIQVWPWNQVAWLGDILVAPKYRDQGIGTRLLRRMEDRARQLQCLVLMDQPPANHPAVQFYLTKGFRICGYNDRFYPSSEESTALFLCKDLVD